MKDNVTFIEDLFDADILTGSNDYITKGNLERDQFSQQLGGRHIRTFDKENSYEINSGMRMPRSIPPKDFRLIPNLQPQPQHQPQSYYQHFEHELSCMTVANHIKECPICSRFYNCDNSMYIVCVVLLIIVCIILLKRIIEKN